MLHVQSIMSDSLQPYGLQPTKLLCPQDSPVKNIGVGCHFLLQEIILTQVLSLHLLHLLHCQEDPLALSHLGFPNGILLNHKKIMKSCHLLQHGWTGGYYAQYNKSEERDKYCMLSPVCGISKQANKCNKTETDSEIQRTNQWLPVERRKGRQTQKEIKTYQLLCIK